MNMLWIAGFFAVLCAAHSLSICPCSGTIDGQALSDDLRDKMKSQESLQGLGVSDDTCRNGAQFCTTDDISQTGHDGNVPQCLSYKASGTIMGETMDINVQDCIYGPPEMTGQCESGEIAIAGIKGSMCFTVPSSTTPKPLVFTTTAGFSGGLSCPCDSNFNGVALPDIARNQFKEELTQNGLTVSDDTCVNGANRCNSQQINDNDPANVPQCMTWHGEGTVDGQYMVATVKDCVYVPQFRAGGCQSNYFGGLTANACFTG